MKFKAVFFLILSTTILLSLTTIAKDPLEIHLSKGENIILVEEYFSSITVSSLIYYHPEIQSVSMQDYGQTFGFVNTLGGIGTDFLIMPSKTYEIYVSENITINF